MEVFVMLIGVGCDKLITRPVLTNKQPVIKITGESN